jgi:hypothetical protein
MCGLSRLSSGITLHAGRAIGSSAIALYGHTLLGVHHRSELREDHPTHGHQVALALEHARKVGEIGLEPVLFTVF